MRSRTKSQWGRTALVAVMLGAMLFGALALFDGATPAADADPPTLTATGADTDMDEGGVVAPFSAASVMSLAVGEGITTLVVTVDIGEGNSERLQFNGASMQLNDANSVTGGTVTGSVVQAGGPSGIATVTFVFSPAADAATVETFIDTLEYRHTGNVPTGGDRAPTITSITHDGGTPGTTADDETAALGITSRVTVIPVNDAPTWTNRPTEITVAENTASPVELRPVPAVTPPFQGSFGDVDGQNADMTLTLAVTAGTLTGTNTAGVVATGNGTATLVLTGSSLSINNYLGNAANVQYTGPVGVSGVAAATLTLTANDGGNTGTGGELELEFDVDINIDPLPVFTVCVVKILGDNASTITMPGEARFDVVVNGVALNGQLQPTAGNQNCMAPQGAGAASFEVPAGASFTIIEADTTPGVGPVEISCSVAEIEVTSRTVDGVLATRSVAVDLDPNENEVECTFVNDTIPVCVSKRFGEGAETLIDANMASIEDVEFALDDGPGQVPLSPTCNEIPSIEYFVAPGSTFMISETVTAGSPMRAVDISCNQREAVGSIDLDTASVTVDTNVEQLETIRCTFTNDALIVCVTKTLGNNAVASGAMPGDFTFDLTPAGDAAQQLVPSSEDPLCRDQRLRLAINSAATVGTALPPGTTFSLAEQDPGPQVGLDDAYCQAGQSDFDLTEGTSTIENISAPDGVSRIDCYFRNESVRVCVEKQLGQTASQGGFTVTGTFTATIDGVSTQQTMTPQPPADENPCDAAGDYFVFYVAPGTTVELTEALPLGSPLGLLAAACVESGEGDQPLQSSLAGQKVTFDASNLNVKCALTNDIGVVCITKTVLAGAEMAGYTAAEFGFDVTFDGETAPAVSDGCGTSDSTSQEVTGFAYRPYSTVTVQEVDNSTNPLPNALISAECEAGEEEPVFNVPGSDSVTFTDVGGAVSCEFRNDTLILCVSKQVGATAQEAGFTASQFGFSVVDGGETISSFGAACDGEDTASHRSVAYALKPEPDGPGTVTVTETSTDLDAKVGLVSADCFPGLRAATTNLATRSVVSPKDHGGDSILLCTFVNESTAVTLAKTLITNDGATASVGDFLFDVFDSDGAALESGLSTGAKFYAAQGSTFTISERTAVGFTSTATCSDVAVAATQALSAAVSVTHTPGAGVSEVVCTFVNDDIAPVPVCAMLIFEEGSTGFTLDDFNLELFKDGQLIGQRSAGDPFDAACENTTDNTAELLPGSLVQLGKVFADGSSFAFAVSIADPDGLLVFEPLSCSVDAPVDAQALAGPDPVTFAVDPGASRVSCVARANEKPLVVNSGGGLPGGRPPYVEPVVAAAAAAPAPEAAQVVAVAVAAPIAVTGSSTTGVTLPVAFGLLSAGFVGLGFDRRRRRNRHQLG